jgi:hypothetical protein
MLGKHFTIELHSQPTITYHFFIWRHWVWIRTSHLLGRRSYLLSHSASPFFVMGFSKWCLMNYLLRAGFKQQSSSSLPPE